MSSYSNAGDSSDEDFELGDGDYSKQMEDILDSDNSGGSDDEGFLYDGQDADTSTAAYKEQLADVLEEDVSSDSENEEDDAAEDPSLLNVEPDNVSTKAPSVQTQEDVPATPIPVKPAKSYLHPTISRLRSNAPQVSRTVSNGSVGSFASHVRPDVSRSASHISDFGSRPSSPAAVGAQSSAQTSDVGDFENAREVFRWIQLRQIAQHVFARSSSKAVSVLGAIGHGSPTVFAVNGFICVGTDAGRVFVYDYKQKLRCICGQESSGKSVGAVTALALSHDHTYIATGHVSGHVQLFEIANPLLPARSVAPTNVAAVSSGRQEGHLVGSRIVNIDFIAGRHTAIVSADDRGLAFYHSLGKVLFVEASDTIRILGRYEDDPSQGRQQAVAPGSFRRRARPYSTILAMQPLPLGTVPHPTDTYNLIALLTPTKLVIVGLKPSPRTWLKRKRPESSKDNVKGSLAWWPSASSSDSNLSSITNPVIAYSWNDTCYLLRISETKIKQMVENPKTNRKTEVETGVVVFNDAASWVAEDVIIAMQWLNATQLIILTRSTIDILDTRTLHRVEQVRQDASILVTPSLELTRNGALPYTDSVLDVAHSIRTYKGKVFLLRRNDIQVGTLLSWADRILALVDEGDFLNAIDLARTYYIGTAPGNQNGLPEEPASRQAMIGSKIRELMTASAQYSFSDDRMTDATHFTPDNRGVDRTSTFENLVGSCARACLALDDFEFLFEDLYQYYEDYGILGIFYEQLEKFILDADITAVPPRISKGLVAWCEDAGQIERAEQLIWHIQPDCLDINQAIIFCRTHQSYDALIYVYTRALKDYVSSIVEMISLISKLMKTRRSSDSANLATFESDANKIFPYLSSILSGLTYPSEEPLEPSEARQAKKDIYGFLFYGRSAVWPLGESGKLILTSDEGGVEPTYPYARLLLKFDAEAFLHALDIAFEDSYLNDESQGASRLVIVKVLLDIISSGDLSPSHVTLVNIFIARNVPKYPQFIHVPPSSLHNILVNLAEDPDVATKEDRQLAVEYLLSVYTPHDTDSLTQLFRQAEFFRILRSWHRQEQQWGALMAAYLQDEDLGSEELFKSVDSAIDTSIRASRGQLPQEVIVAVSDAIERLVNASAIGTATLLDSRMPQLHLKAINTIPHDARYQQFVYLRHLIDPKASEGDEHEVGKDLHRPSQNLPKDLRELYLSLYCHFHPFDVSKALQRLPEHYIHWKDAARICRTGFVYDAVIWTEYLHDGVQSSLASTVEFEAIIIEEIVRTLEADDTLEESVQLQVDRYLALARSAIEMCLQFSTSTNKSASTEDVWFKLLSSHIKSVQTITRSCSEVSLAEQPSDDHKVQLESQCLRASRSIIQETFTALVSVISSRAVSFASLFKKLVDNAAEAHAAEGTPYNEFRSILSSMLDSYRTDNDMLAISQRLVERDLFETVAELTRERQKGWQAGGGPCAACGKSISSSEPGLSLIISRTGSIRHSNCS